MKRDLVRRRRMGDEGRRRDHSRIEPGDPERRHSSAQTSLGATTEGGFGAVIVSSQAAYMDLT
jgi:hypothetical protein